MTSTETARARSLRQRETKAEHTLWLRLRDRRLGGHKFVRQYPIGPFFVDFACREERLIVELDGSQHADDPRDASRELFLNRQNFAVLRFWNPEIFASLDGVCETILAALAGLLDPFDRYSRPSSALSGIFSPPAGRREPPGQRLRPAERDPSPRRGEGVRRTDEGSRDAITDSPDCLLPLETSLAP